MRSHEHFADFADDLRSRRTAVKKELNEQNRLLDATRRHLSVVSEANWLLGEAIRRVQTSFKDTVEKLVTSSIRAVYEKDIEFSLEFEQKGRGLECKPITKEDGEEFDLDGDIGGGLLDLISFTSKIVFWKIQAKGRPIFIFDEPFRFLGHGSTILLVGQLLKRLANELGVQFIIVSHEDELAEIADRSFRVVNKSGIAKVTNNG